MMLFIRVCTNSIMKRTLLLCLFLVFVFITNAQGKHTEIQLGSKYSLGEIEAAIEKANWCGYYHETENFQLLFDDGAIALLKNKAEISAKPSEIALSPACFQTEFTSLNNIYVITSEGWILVPKKSAESKNSKTN